MRKRNNRKPRPIARLLSPEQHSRLIVGARMHLTLLCNGTATREHVVTVAAAFNIGVALAHLSKNAAYQSLFESAQKRLMASVSQGDSVGLPDDAAQELKIAFNKLDRYIGVQNDRALLRAIDFIDRAISTGDGAEVANLPD